MSSPARCVSVSIREPISGRDCSSFWKRKNRGSRTRGGEEHQSDRHGNRRQTDGQPPPARAAADGVVNEPQDRDADGERDRPFLEPVAEPRAPALDGEAVVPREAMTRRGDWQLEQGLDDSEGNEDEQKPVERLARFSFREIAQPRGRPQGDQPTQHGKRPGEADEMKPVAGLRVRDRAPAVFGAQGVSGRCCFRRPDDRRLRDRPLLSDRASADRQNQGSEEEQRCDPRPHAQNLHGRLARCRIRAGPPRKNSHLRGVVPRCAFLPHPPER